MEVAAATEELSVEEVSEVAAKQEETEAVAEVETSPDTEAAHEEEAAAATEESAEEVTNQIVFVKLNWDDIQHLLLLNTFEHSALYIQIAYLLNRIQIKLK